MSRSLLPSLLLMVCLSGCIAQDRLNATCEWTHDLPVPLDTRSAQAKRHLADDATVAEEVAIRYADTQRGHRSRHFAGVDEYHRTREQCLATLFSEIASTHGVEVGHVRDLLGRRPVAWDLGMLLSFATIDALVATGLVGWIFSRFAGDNAMPSWVATSIVSVIASAGSVVAFELWVGITEAVRLHDSHMSYRALRLPWHEDRRELFIAGIVLFLLVAAVRHHRSGVQERPI